MELTGESRETQVQPPLGAWRAFFRVKMGVARTRRITYRLRNGRGRIQRYSDRPVVLHHHTATIEIPEVLRARPGMVRFRKTGPRRYEFFIYRVGTTDYEHCAWMLRTFPNPLRSTGRRWLVI